jgi:3-oxoacyl-[acyl-carrier protein] reductase
MDLGLEKKVALVAGASQGLGFAVAERLAGEGARVVVASRDAERIRSAAKKIAARTGGEVAPVALDVRDPDAGERFVEAARSAFGDPAILVTNAGGPPPGPFARFSLQDFEEAVRLTFLSAVRLTQAALPAMKAAGWGRVIHITSSTIHEPSVALFLSSSVRPAVAGFSKALAREVARDGITVNVVSPGILGTDRLRELAVHLAQESGHTVDEELVAMGEAVPVGRIGDPGELAATVAFLASVPAAYITGVALRVDGGKVSSLL